MSDTYVTIPLKTLRGTMDIDHTVYDLRRKCSAATLQGLDFPTVWNDVLRKHPLVLGPPIQVYHGDVPHLEIPLLTGRHLVYNSSKREYSLF